MKHIIALFLASPLFTMGQNYPTNYFSAPLDTPLIITGSFGEIRNEHLHSGIDLSTGEYEELPVSAAADGYVSRVKVSADGYGKAIYITHPNGYVTVYGHLEKFYASVNEFVRKIQYERKVFELDENLKENQFPVRKGDVIAYSGSSGSAEGPHLHFEIRDEKTEEAINPLLFGLPFNDHIAPDITDIRIIPQRETGIVNTTDTAESIDVIQDDEGGLKLNTAEYPIVYGNISFAVAATDRSDSSDGTLSIYSAELYVDDKPAFGWKYDRVNFDYTRDVNAHIDYKCKVRDNQTFERFIRLPGDRLNMYFDTAVTGNQVFDEDKAHDIRIIVRDFKGNSKEIQFQVITYVTASENRRQPRNPDAVEVGTDKGVAFHKSNLDVVIPDGALYESAEYDDEALPGGSEFLSDVYRVGNEYVPLRKAISVGIKPRVDLPDSLKKKQLIVRLGPYDEMKPCGGQWEGKFLTAKSNWFGKFAVMIDTIPPKVEKYYVPADMNTMYGGEVRVKITDELSGIKNYSGKVDGKWRLFEYDRKNDMLISNIDPLMENRDHSIEITVTDERGNITVWKSSFYF